MIHHLYHRRFCLLETLFSCHYPTQKLVMIPQYKKVSVLLNLSFQLLLHRILYCFHTVLFTMAWTHLLSFSVVILCTTTCRKPVSLPSPSSPSCPQYKFCQVLKTQFTLPFFCEALCHHSRPLPCLNFWDPFMVSLIWYAEIHLRMYFILSFHHFQKSNVTELGTEKNAEKGKERWIGKGPGNPHLLGEEPQNHR